jgi:RHS repeat-associated protein
VRQSAGTTTYYLVDANNHTGYAQVLEELAAVGGTPNVSYVMGDDVMGQCGASTTDPRWLLHDGHGSTRLLADKNAAITSHYGYEAYGNVQGGSSTTADLAPTSRLYCGEQYDSALKMYNLRARYYDPSNARFNQMDSFAGNNEDPQSLHKYLYANCDPVNGVDPSGNFTAAEILATFAVIGILAAVVVGAIVAKKYFAPLNAELYQPGMKGSPTYQAATALLATARQSMDQLGTPKATRYYDDFFSEIKPGDVNSDNFFFMKPGTTSANGMTLIFKPDQVYLSADWSTAKFTDLQRSLILLHELRHSIDGAGEKHAYRAQYIAETRYRAAHNSGKLPTPPAEPAKVVFSEAAYGDNAWQKYLPLSDRQAIVLEMNTNGQIADDTWPGN